MSQHADHDYASAGDTSHGEIAKPNTKAIWRTFWILFAVTAVEFIVALGMDLGPTLKIAIFVGLTFVKAFYIVGEFMHLKHEVKVLIWSIVLPAMFVVWLVIALLVEGDSILNAQ